MKEWAVLVTVPIAGWLSVPVVGERVHGKYLRQICILGSDKLSRGRFLDSILSVMLWVFLAGDRIRYKVM